MTREEHKAEAERLLRIWEEGSQDWAITWAAHLLAAAQVHATLATIEA